MAEAGVPYCGAMSRPAIARKPDSYFICTQDRGHGGMWHAACDGRGHIPARWLRSSAEQYWTPDLEKTHSHGGSDG